ncbi:MAG TPA: hypothetical protein ENI68_03560 [Gammaproteobacteria bacterium]|nr:hypothetical protein [Gammaproteobacteria bacterium]
MKKILDGTTNEYAQRHGYQLFPLARLYPDNKADLTGSRSWPVRFSSRMRSVLRVTGGYPL